MEDIDLNISNGTCYFAAGAQAADGFIPCGNAALEGYAKSCCYVGDKCLSSQACFNTKCKREQKTEKKKEKSRKGTPSNIERKRRLII